MTESKSRRTFTEEFKLQIVGLYNAGKPASEIVREYDIGESTLYRWVSRINKTGSTKEVINRTPMEGELLKLRKENKHLRMENDILKQAALILGQR